MEIPQPPEPNEDPANHPYHHGGNAESQPFQMDPEVSQLVPTGESALDHTPQAFKEVIEGDQTSEEWRVPASTATKEAIVDTIKGYVSSDQYKPTEKEKKLSYAAACPVVELVKPGEDPDEAMYLTYRAEYDRGAELEGGPVARIEWGIQHNEESRVFGGGVDYVVELLEDNSLRVERKLSMVDMGEIITKAQEMRQATPEALPELTSQLTGAILRAANADNKSGVEQRDIGLSFVSEAEAVTLLNLIESAIDARLQVEAQLRTLGNKWFRRWFFQ